MREVRSALTTIKGLKALTIQLAPPVAKFKMDAGATSLQEIVKAVRSAPGHFDAKLMLEEDPKLTQSVLDELDAALTSVEGVKNTGYPDDQGRRVIVFDLQKRTLFGALVKAAKGVGVTLSTPRAETKKAAGQ